MQFGFFEFLEQVGSIFKGEGANVSEKWVRIGLLVVKLKSPIRINFSYLFDSLLIIISRLVVKSGSLKLGGFYTPVTKISCLRIVFSMARISTSEGLSISLVWLDKWSII